MAPLKCAIEKLYQERVDRQMARFVVLILTILIVPSGAAEGQTIFYTGNLSYSSGSYFFSESTRMFGFTNGLGIRGERLSITLSLPYISQTSPWVSNTGIGGLPTGGKEHGKLGQGSGKGGGQNGGSGGGSGQSLFKNSLTGNVNVFRVVPVAERADSSPIEFTDTLDYQEQGFSDPFLTGSFTLMNGSDRFGNRFTMNLNTSVKFPTSRIQNGFGTEAFDIGAGTTFGYTFLTGWGLLLDLMVWRLGDLEELKLKDPLSISLGVSRILWKSDWILNLSATGYTEVVEGYVPPRTIQFGAGKKITPRCFYSATLGTGLSESSADLMLSLGWSIDL